MQQKPKSPAPGSPASRAKAGPCGLGPAQRNYRATKYKSLAMVSPFYPAALEVYPGNPRTVTTATPCHPFDQRTRGHVERRREKSLARRVRNVRGHQAGLNRSGRGKGNEYRAVGLGMVCPLGKSSGLSKARKGEGVSKFLRLVPMPRFLEKRRDRGPHSSFALCLPVAP